MLIPTRIAPAALISLFRSSRMCSMSGIRPSAFGCRCDAAKRLPSTRAPVTVSPSFDMADYGTGRLSPAAACAASPSAERGRLLLQVADLLLQLVDLLLVLRRLHGLSLLGLVRLIVMQVLHLGLQDAHRLAERPGSVGQLLRPEQHDQYHRDDEYLPRAVEQVTNHVCPHSAGSAFPRLGSLAPESLHVTPMKPSVRAQRAAPA